VPELYRAKLTGGPVFPCGWDDAGRFYFIRWPASEHRSVPDLGTTGFD